MVSAMLEEAAGDITLLDTIISDHQDLLNRYPDSEFAATLMFQLAELHYERSQLEYQQAMAQYEAENEKYHRGEIKDEPIQPQFNFKSTIHYCTQLLELYESLPYRDKILYKLAIAYLESGHSEESQTTFEQLVDEYPQSQMRFEAHFRIAEFYFENRQFDEAITHYKRLAQDWDNPYFDMALYKLGWSFYNQQNYRDAISTFLMLIENINLVERTDSTRFSATTMDLRTEAIHYIAGSLTEFGGPQLARTVFQDHRDKDYIPDVLSKMAELYENRTFYGKAIDAYRLLLEYYPFHIKAPEYYQRIVYNHESAEQHQTALDVRAEIVRYFGPNSDWVSEYPSGELNKAGLTIARDNLVYLGQYYQATGQQTDSSRYYLKAIDTYQDYLTLFPEEENSSEIQYYNAECHYQIGEYVKAAEVYFDLVNRYPDSDYREKAAFNRIYSYSKVTPVATSRMDTLYVDNFIGSDSSLVLFDIHSNDAQILQSCNDFTTLFPDSKWIDQVYMTYGQVLSEYGAYESAIQTYKRVLAITPTSSFAQAAGMNVGQCYFDAGRFSKARDWFESFQSNADTTRYADRAHRMAASSTFRMAEDLDEQGKHEQAAYLLLSIVSSQADSSFRERALYEAALQFQQVDSLLKAARTFERLAFRFPKSDLADKGLFQAAQLRELLQDWQLAASDYMKLVETFPSSEYSQQALKNAAACYEFIEDWIAAKTTYKRYVELFPQDRNGQIESLTKIGEMAYKADQFDEAEVYFDRTVQTYEMYQQQNFAVDSYYVAQALFMKGELVFTQYKKIDLVPPFEQQLKLKVEYFNRVVGKYSAAIKFKIADWSTASSYRIGQCFEEFVRAFLQAPLPTQLSTEQQTIYRQQLAERAQGYKTKALETYQKNVEQAEANSIENSWVAKSRQRIKVLTHELQQVETVNRSQR